MGHSKLNCDSKRFRLPDIFTDPRVWSVPCIIYPSMAVRSVDYIPNPASKPNYFSSLLRAGGALLRSLLAGPTICGPRKPERRFQ